MIYNLDVCHAVVECTPAPKATKDMRKRKIEHRRLQLCHRPGWVTVACLADPLTVCILVVLIMIHNWSNLQQWSRNKDAHHRNIFCAMLHFNKVNETLMRCNPTLVVSEKHCSNTARNVYAYLQTAVAIFYYWQALQVSAVVTAMILLLSGDIELNPGPLTVDDLKAVRTALWDACAKWMDIGIELDMKVARLETINHNKQGEAGSCLTAMLTDWLKQTTPQPTWEALVDALKSPVVGYAHLADAIQRKYCNKDISKPQSTCGIQVSTPSDPEEINRSIRCCFANSLKDKYRSEVSTVLALQWPPPPTLKVFNLAMISQQVLQYAPDYELVRLLQRGNVSDAVSSRNQVTLEEISGNLHSKGRKVILIEGAPGAGKSTLAWHLCKQWETGKLFQEFEIVLFVQLREPGTQSARSLEDMLPALSPNKKEVVSAIQYCGGHQVLLILDSWDEFTPGLDRETVIKNIICHPSRLNLHYSALIITSRPVATAQLQRFITTRVEIAGFLRSEIKRYFTEAIGNPQIVERLTDHLRERPVIEASCYLPLNTAIVTHLFLALNHTLPTTLHGVFTSLVTNCIKRHLERQAGEGEIPEHTSRVISFLRRHLRRQVEERGVPEIGIPPGIQKQFNNLCALAYHGVMENKATFTAADLQSFKLPTELSTLSLIQGVASFAAHGECKLYNFFHLSTQELLAAFYISKMKPPKQVKIFNQLFEQPRFANVFQFYAAFTKLQTPGIRNTVSSIVKRNDKTLILSLLQCLYEAQDDALCQFVGSELKKELNLSQQTLSPVDCLSVGYFVGSVCPTTTGQFKLTLMINGLEEFGVTLLVRELAKCGIPSATQAAAAVETENLYLELVGQRSNSSFEERAIVISKLGQYVKEMSLDSNVIGDDGARCLSAAIENMVNLQVLYLATNVITDAGCSVLCAALKECKNLQQLYLARNVITDAGCSVLCAALKECKNLQQLYLDDNSITDEGLKPLSAALKRLVNLQELYLDSNRLTDSSVERLCELIKTAKCLKTLFLGAPEFTEEGKAQLRQARNERNPDFVVLNVYFWQ